MIVRPTIFIGMPIFEGWEHVAHTLETIRSQTYSEFRVLISVDGGDWRSHDACVPFLMDPRFSIIVHEDRLGWEGNINYLANQLNEDFFCYWQHDDYCDPGYLEKLVMHAISHPEASAIYCDMQVFGEINHITRQKSITGFALERVLSQIDKPNNAAIRCLIRASALRASLPIKLTATWLMSLARAGELHRVPELLYFRRIRRDALEFTMPRRPATDMWRASLDWGLGALENAFPLIQKEERRRLFSMVVSRIMNDQYRGKLKYKFAGTTRDLKVKFIRQLLDEAEMLLGWQPHKDIPHSDRQGRSAEMHQQNARLLDGEDLIIDALLDNRFLTDDAIVDQYQPVEQAASLPPGRSGLVRRAIGKLFY